MKYLTLLLVLGININLARADIDNCEQPDAPAIPNGSYATEKELVGAVKAVKQLQTASEQYRECVDKAFAAARKKAKRREEPLSKEEQLFFTKLYNRSVELENNTAAALNEEIKRYKANNQ